MDNRDKPSMDVKDFSLPGDAKEQEQRQAQINLKLFKSLFEKVADEYVSKGFNKERAIIMLRHPEKKFIHSRDLKSCRDRLSSSYNLLKIYAEKGVISEAEWIEISEQYAQLDTTFLEPLRIALRETESPTKAHERGTSGRYRGSKGGRKH